MIIGIDLGTTNCTLAYAGVDCRINQYSIPQKMSLSNDASSQVLPSFYFFPLHEESHEPVVGHYARDRGRELPDRLISSAKSWLCHDGIDRRSSFLPLGDLPTKISPLSVNAAYLSHLCAAWEKSHPEHRIEEQKIYITVPASFDPSARQLVQEAAHEAGLSAAILIEEPLATFYAWLAHHQQDWRSQLRVSDLVLVVDVGGGTTDFSLISVEEDQGNLTLVRKAVGDHLLLGGDNIDLTLAYYVQTKFQRELDRWQFLSLIHSCRQAKEILLSESPPSSVPITIQGKGSRLIANTLTISLEQHEVQKVIVEGFFPMLSKDVRVERGKQSALVETGLPYARDPRITAHLAAFLARANCGQPTAVLFNGGTMKASVFQTSILKALTQWNSMPPRVLAEVDLDFAVSQGAVYYGWTRAHEGIRVRAGTSRAFFIGVESATPAVPGISPPIKAICLVPLGMEEGEHTVLDNQTFNLLFNESALFRFFSCHSPQLSSGNAVTLGSVVHNWKEELTELHPIETILDSQTEERVVQVKLSAKITEMGMMELWCISEDNRRWKLEFDIRKEN